MLDLSAQIPAMEAAAAARGIPVDDPAGLLWPAAVGATQIVWRNTVIEDWHASPGGLPDGEMLRANAATVRVVHDALSAGASWREAADAVTAKDRLLPDGRTLGAYAGKRLPALRREALGQARMLDDVEAAIDRRAALLFAVTFTMLSGSDWHGMPVWPARVEAFCRSVEDPDDAHWGVHSLASTGPRPEQIADVDTLRDLLLDGPDRLTAAAAAWCITAMLGFVHVPQ